MINVNIKFNQRKPETVKGLSLVLGLDLVSDSVIEDSLIESRPTET